MIKTILTVAILVFLLFYFREDWQNIIESETFREFAAKLLVWGKAVFEALGRLFSAVLVWVKGVFA